MKKLTKNRILAWVMCISMVMTMLPAAALAASPVDLPAGTITQADSDKDGSTGTYKEISVDAGGHATVYVAVADPSKFTADAPTDSYWTVTAVVTPGDPDTSADTAVVEKVTALNIAANADITILATTYTSLVSDGAAITNNGTLTIKGDVENLTATGPNVIIDGNVGTLTAKGDKVVVNGDVTKEVKIEGSNVTVEVTGSVGDSRTVFAPLSSGQMPSAIYCGDGSSGSVTVGGNVYGKIGNWGAGSTTLKVKIGSNIDLDLIDIYGTDTDAAYDAATNTLRVYGRAVGNEVKNNTSAAVPYNVIVENGTFNSNGQAITGNVTFEAGAYTLTDANKNGDVTGLPTVTDGVTANTEVKYADENADNTFLKRVVFKEGAAGYVDGRLHFTNDRTEIKVGAGAYAAFAYADLDWQNATDQKPFAIGDNAFINLTAIRANDQSNHFGVLDNSVFSKLNSSGEGYSFGNNITFLMGEHATLENHITLPDNATATLHFYTANTTDKSITVGEGANLTVLGKDTSNKLTINGAGVTTVEENGTLTLQHVDHTRDNGVKDIVTATGATVVMDDSVTYTGSTNGQGSFITGSGETDKGIPATVSLSFGGKEALTVDEPQALDPSITLGEDPTEITYTNVAYKEDPTGTYTLTLSSADDSETLDIAQIFFEEPGTMIASTVAGFSADVMVNGTGAGTEQQVNSFALTGPLTTVYLDNLKKDDKVEINFYQTAQGDDDVIALPDQATTGDDLTVDLKNGSYQANFIVNDGDRMIINMDANSSIAAASTFTLGKGATLEIHGGKVFTRLTADNPDVTVLLDNVTWTGKVENTPDHPMVLFTDKATNAKLVIEGTTSITNTAATADNGGNAGQGVNTSATAISHDQCVALYNRSASLTVDVQKGATLTVQGGTGNQAASVSDVFYGGAGIYNTGTLTFTGKGAAQITGGTGSHGYNWATAATDGAVSGAQVKTAATGGSGGTGGNGIYSSGTLNVAMDSATWNEGQLAVTGGTGGVGGTGQQAAPATVACHDGNDYNNNYAAKTLGGTGGSGGASGTGIKDTGTIKVSSGVFLTYSGTGGDGGSAGIGNTTTGCDAQFHDSINHSHSFSGNPGAKGADSSLAIDGVNMTVSGGTTYAQGGEDRNNQVGVNLTGKATVSGGTIWAGIKTDSGFDTSKAGSLSTAVTGHLGIAGFNAPADAIVSGVTEYADGTHDAAYTRVKFAGLEGSIYRVVSASINVTTFNSGVEDVAYTYGTQDVYVNPQGFAYFYLPGNGDSGDYTTQIQSVVVQDIRTGVYYKLDQAEAKTIRDGKSAAPTEANNYIQLTGTWGEAFQNGFEICYSGVDMGAVEAILGLTVSQDPYTLDTPEKLAALAMVANTTDKDFTNIDFKLVGDLDMSKLLWAYPIGIAEHPFNGIIAGGSTGGGFGTTAQRTITGLRMPKDYENDVYGLFGYTDGANISYLTVSGAAIAGKPYVKTLESSYTANRGMNLATASGGQYSWAATDMKWHGAVNYMGAIVGHAVDTAIGGCSATTMTMEAVNPTAGDAYAGGLAGFMDGTAISEGSVTTVSVTADCQAAGSSAYAGGVVGYVEDADITHVNLGGDGASVTVTAVPGTGAETTYAGGVAGKTVRCTVSNFPSGWLDVLTGTKAQTYKPGSTAYAGGIVGASEGSTFENLVFSTGHGANAVTADGYNSSTDGTRYAGGFAASSRNDVVKDVQIIGGTGDTAVTITANAGDAGGFAARTDGSRFYRSFVRGAAVTGASYVHLIQTAVNTQMYGCYAQGCTAGTHAFDTVTGGKYVGCYTYATGNTAWAENNHNGQFYNCYYPGSGTDAKHTDGVVAVDAATLRDAAMACMNSELLRTEGAAHTNHSGFDWAEFGAPIAYVTDTTPVNGGYPVHGVPHLIELKVVEGAGYGTARLTPDNKTVIAITESDNYSSYWVMGGTDTDVNVKALVELADTDNAFYGIDEAPDTAITMSGTAAGSTGTGHLNNVIMDAVVSLKFVPKTFTFYTLDLKSVDTSAGDGDSTNTHGEASVLLNASQVHRYTNAGTALTDGNYSNIGTPADNDQAIQTVVLSVDNGARLSVPATPAGWTRDPKSTSSYYHYTVAAPGATAGQVQAFLRGVSVTPASTAAKYRVSAFLYESKVSFIDSSYGGHFYQYVPANVSWSAAYKSATDFVTTLGRADSYLAAITSAGENNYLFNTLHAYNAWMAAVRTQVTTGVDDVDTLLNGKPDGWYWVAGPEAGTRFMTALTGSANKVSGQYSNWRGGEPNNAGGEWAAVFAYGGRNDWNDYSGTNQYGYVIEYQAGQDVKGANFANDYYDYTKTQDTGVVLPPDTNGGGNKPDPKPDPKPDTGLPMDPALTGVAKLLNTVDHMAYLVGYDTGSFGPASNMTRAEAAMMFYRLLLKQDVDLTAGFTDVADGAWYAQAVNTLASMGIINGVGGGRFAPGRSITRAEFVAMAMRFADHLAPGSRTFTDVPETHWAYESIMSATGFGWISGYADGTFKPSGTITRAEVTTIVNHMLGRAADEAYVDAHLDELNTFPDVKAGYWAYYNILEAANAHGYAKSNGEETWMIP